MDKIITKKPKAMLPILALLALAACAVNIMAAKYYRLLEPERPLYLGLRSIDSAAALSYINLESATDRRDFYRQFWTGRNQDREEFEKRCEFAFRMFGKWEPLSDERIPVYVKYGTPTTRQEIAPQKKIGIVSKESVKPAEIWTYKAAGLEFDFIRPAQAFVRIAVCEFGEKVTRGYLREDTLASPAYPESAAALNFDMTCGRFRQKKNLTRTEIYINLDLEDTSGVSFLRRVQVWDKKDSLVYDKQNRERPAQTGGFFTTKSTSGWNRPNTA